MDDQALTWTCTATLEYIVHDQKDCHDDDHHADKILSAFLSGYPCAELVAPAEDEVDEGTCAESDYKMPSCICTVSNHTVDHLGNSVDDSDEGEDHTETGVGYTVFFAECRHCEREVLTYEIEHGISYHRRKNHSPLPVVE